MNMTLSHIIFSGISLSTRLGTRSELLLNCNKRLYSSTENLRKTYLYDYHVEKGGRMVPFGGWSMPVQYKDGIRDSHHHVRNHVGIFDVSHMMQTKIHGKDRVAFMESLTLANVKILKPGVGCLTVFTNEKGGINDDLIVTNTSEGYLYVVSNAACDHKDFANMEKKCAEFHSKGLDVTLERLTDSLIAVQGPSAAKVLQPGLTFELADLPFMRSILTSVFDIPNCRVTRCGYTGEDGVEISVTCEKVIELLENLLNSNVDEVRLAGLGARDTLRLEAGLCLYGNDMDETTTPIEASLGWLLGKRRRQLADFPGASHILNHFKNPPQRQRVGFTSTGPSPRHGSDIYDESGKNVIGIVTSGCPSPTLKKNIAMGYVKPEYTAVGTNVVFDIRKKMVPGQVAKMPFVPTNYYIVKK
ncbi:aminomethyltransferase, mitochondrial [Octopus bimaculoides]|uniref:Aminomethyltransferase n=1 Tax=Octopus bimaculoides TaxID=37653 RepID=A0A0L8HFV4_OCTBM|nr:aminomethyltransferase, mitochondrial [Octopus bimaculoides]|eukprot:XP_014772981.1 PREDICTED: aminomethyltransferase, mitochondrial-like [Octopus bimaculoides]